MSRGQVSDGTEKFLRVLELNPDDVPAVFALATSTRHAFADSEVRRMQNLLDRPRLRADDRELIHFALATVLDKRGSHDEAFAHAIAGNKSKKANYLRCGLGFDQADHRVFCNQVLELFSSDGFSRLPSSGLDSERQG